MINKDITIALTSCWRYSLLKKTINSISQSINLEQYTRIMTEDSSDLNHIEKIKNEERHGFLRWWKVIYTCWSGKKELYQRHFEALKKLYNNIKTPYVFHCEDDQIFKKTNYDYILESKNILENFSSIGIVLLRDIKKDFWLKKTGIKKTRYYELLTEQTLIFNNKTYIYCTDENSFSLQPWLRRTAQMIKIMFWHENYVDEWQISKRFNKLELKSIIPEVWIYNHINPIFNSTKNIKNMWIFKYIYQTLKWTLCYRTRLLFKYITRK